MKGIKGWAEWCDPFYPLHPSKELLALQKFAPNGAKNRAQFSQL
jgi:hypothetical protein